jgi:uncharacterized protein (DUF1786 family)
MNRILAIDIGGGTQDILLYDSDKPLDNCIQMILPSPTLLVASQISCATAEKKAIYLHGDVMGGGPSVRAIKTHLAAGLPVSATPGAALTVKDNLEQVAMLGISLSDKAPPGSLSIRLGDIDPGMYSRMLREVGENIPTRFAVAVQDHGFSPHESNRIFRFRLWEHFMEEGGSLDKLAYSTVPPFYTRMQAVQRTLPGALVMDTCGAALLGALCDERVRNAAEDSAVAVVNIGNQHTFAAIVRGRQVTGLFEHHTGRMTAEKIVDYTDRLINGTLTNREIIDDGGHGCFPPQKAVRVSLVAVTGPRRMLLSGSQWYFASPLGNMMLMGCFGLIAAALTSPDWKDGC